MALFHVARYRGTERAGPEAAAAEEGAESRARTLLERLQSRARERQQQREQEEQKQQQQQRESVQAAEPAGRRRRRPRRSRGRVSSQASPQEPASKRLKEDGGAADVDAGTDGPGTDAVAAARPPDEPPAPAPLLGGFRRIKTPKVSGLGRNEPCMVREPTQAAHDGPRPRNAQTPLDPPWQSWAWSATLRLLVQVQPFLPAWLREPSCVERSVTEHLVPLEALPEVHPDLQRKLRDQGISAYFPGTSYWPCQGSGLSSQVRVSRPDSGFLPPAVQATVIPTLLHSVVNGFLVGRGGFRPSDLCVSAPTGSGKTLAFVIPLVQVRVFTCCIHPNSCLSP